MLLLGFEKERTLLENIKQGASVADIKAILPEMDVEQEDPKTKQSVLHIAAGRPGKRSFHQRARC